MELLEKLSQRQFSELYLCLSYIHSVRHSIYVISHRGSLHKRKYAKLRKKLVSPPSTQTMYKADNQKQIKSLSLSYYNPSIFFLSFAIIFLSKKPCKNIYRMALLWLKTLMSINILVITCHH